MKVIKKKSDIEEARRGSKIHPELIKEVEEYLLLLAEAQGEQDPGEEFSLDEENSIVVLEGGDDAGEILGIGKTPLEGARPKKERCSPEGYFSNRVHKDRGPDGFMLNNIKGMREGFLD